jgi:heat shock protein HtpX
MAHELAHVKHRDILIGTIAATVGGTITYIAHMAGWAAMFGRSDDEDSGGGLSSLLLLILAPIAATLLQMAVSRSREFMADAGGAQISYNPLALASALHHPAQIKLRRLIIPGATAHMFIVNPLHGEYEIIFYHPAEERIARLRYSGEKRATIKWLLKNFDSISFRQR